MPVRVSAVQAGRFRHFYGGVAAGAPAEPLSSKEMGLVRALGKRIRATGTAGGTCLRVVLAWPEEALLGQHERSCPQRNPTRRERFVGLLGVIMPGVFTITLL